MTPSDFRAWRAAVGMTQREAARGLDIDLSSVRRYEAGLWPIPRTVALACRVFLAGRPHEIEPWPLDPPDRDTLRNLRRLLPPQRRGRRPRSVAARP